MDINIHLNYSTLSLICTVVRGKFPQKNPQKMICPRAKNGYRGKPEGVNFEKKAGQNLDRTGRVMYNKDKTARR
jgi:hypothetical protein